MSSNLVEEILNGLKERLDKNNQLLVQANKGYCYTATFTFNDPATIEEIDQFAKNTGWVIPLDYRFLIAS
ncbi:hypothetical protein [Fictibacillus gelatini]|uniref:hypothetical protein n=1 Tax=Fictibacillus gelatini TaxID=225985 RepID=UPI00040E6533|nr:hypothetical protein [Fictibacillus gelatini]